MTTKKLDDTEALNILAKSKPSEICKKTFIGIPSFAVIVGLLIGGYLWSLDASSKRASELTENKKDIQSLADRTTKLENTMQTVKDEVVEVKSISKESLDILKKFEK